MNNLSRSYTNEEGRKETVIANSNDNYTLKLNGNYKVANHKNNKESKIAKKFKDSLLGADIGVKSSGFSSVAILATVIAIATVAILYFLWRF